jgi:hypothetical protein
LALRKALSKKIIYNGFQVIEISPYDKHAVDK